MDFLNDLWGFLKVGKKFWLLPIILSLLLFGALIVFVQRLGSCAIYLYTFLGVDTYCQELS